MPAPTPSLVDSPAADRRSRTAAGVAAVVGAATVFSWGFVIAKVLGLPAPVIATFRLLIGATFLTVVAAVMRAPWPTRWVAVVAAGLAFGIHQLLYITASQRTSIAIVAIIGAMKPLVVTLVARRALGERVPKVFRLWAMVALLGVALVVAANYRDQSRTLFGDLLAVVNLFAVTGYILFSKRARMEGAHTVTFTACMFGVALLVVAPGLLFVDAPLPAAAWQWGLIALLALGPGNGHLLINWAHRSVSAVLLTLVLSLVPLLASIWAHLVFDEPYGWMHAAGMLAVVIAIEGGRRAEVAAEHAEAHTDLAKIAPAAVETDAPP
jgi:drug/metabolite transporter (DMT)-like permease